MRWALNRENCWAVPQGTIAAELIDIGYLCTYSTRKPNYHPAD